MGTQKSPRTKPQIQRRTQKTRATTWPNQARKIQKHNQRVHFSGGEGVTSSTFTITTTVVPITAEDLIAEDTTAEEVCSHTAEDLTEEDLTEEDLTAEDLTDTIQEVEHEYEAEARNQ